MAFSVADVQKKVNCEMPAVAAFSLFDGSGEAGREFVELWPLKRMPVLVDGDRTLAQASIIIEHLGLHHPGPVRLIPPALSSSAMREP